MAVALDAQSSAFTASQSLASYTNAAFTVGSGANRALVVALVCESTTGNSPTAPTLSWDSTGTNQSMQLISTMSDNRTSSEIRHFIFGLVAPTSGNKKLAVGGLNTNCASILAYISWTGVDQTGGTTTFKNAATNNTGSALTVLSANVSGNVGDAAIGVFGSNDSSPTPNQTTWCTASLTSVSFDYYCSNYALMASSPVTMSSSWASAASCNYSVMAINQAGAAPSLGAPRLSGYPLGRMAGYHNLLNAAAPTPTVVLPAATGSTLPMTGVG